MDVRLEVLRIAHDQSKLYYEASGVIHDPIGIANRYLEWLGSEDRVEADPKVLKPLLDEVT